MNLSQYSPGPHSGFSAPSGMRRCVAIANSYEAVHLTAILPGLGIFMTLIFRREGIAETWTCGHAVGGYISRAGMVGCHLLDNGDFDASRRSAFRRTTGVMIDCERPGARSECGPGVARDEVYDCTTLGGNKIVPYDASGLREPGETAPISDQVRRERRRLQRRRPSGRAPQCPVNATFAVRSTSHINGGISQGS